MSEIMCFSSDRNSVEIAFRDYINHYLSDNGRKGYVYDNTISFAEKEDKVNKLIMKEVSRLSGMNIFDGSISMASASSNPNVVWASFAVVNALIDMVLPNVLDKSIGLYTEMRYGGYGDSFLFDVEPNDLFYVSKVGRDQRTVEFQKQFPGQVSIIPENRAISVAVNLYKVMCGKESMAKFVTKAIMSIENQVTKDVYTAFDTAMSAIPETSDEASLMVGGWDKKEAIRVANLVTALNNGSKAVFVGTALALADILPDDANYRYMLDDEYVKLGYVRNFAGFDTLVLPQVADWQKQTTFLKDDRIYVLSVNSQKPVKLCFEGETTTNTINHFDSANLTSATTINKSYGIGIGTNAVAGIITLS